MNYSTTETTKAFEKDFEKQAGHIRTIADTLLYEYFGARCEIFESECEICRRWKALDDLTDNPFASEMR